MFEAMIFDELNDLEWKTPIRYAGGNRPSIYLSPAMPHMYFK